MAEAGIKVFVKSAPVSLPKKTYLAETAKVPGRSIVIRTVVENAKASV
jgi:hypothetical protein